jgi:hypothetical protein
MADNYNYNYNYLNIHLAIWLLNKVFDLLLRLSYKEKFHALYSSPDNTSLITRRISWMEPVAGMGQK